ncbi:ferredoxin [Mycolicibacterium sp. S2-37]|uniref:ferredoxin n=1 Tax=Mycolicibacterium sp. S2-37 TaxID=2810297 RepID=UPI001A94AD7D|nr:ferredoxin [Mycolicibacterium sp. S2-37]MBO0676698.1 ferredoxin [Mycolicibacterium sp. S2-37]
MSVRPDNRLDDSPMVPVTCRACGAEVSARKSSWEQTSVQWNADAIERCPQRRDAEELAAHSRPSVFLSCSELTESILDAVRDGRLEIVDETVDAAP